MRCLSTTVPLLDPLESRLLLSAFLRNQTLIVEGTSGADAISIGTRDGGANIRVIINGQRSYFTGAQVTRIEAYGYRGSDRIEVADALTQPAYIEGARGDDTLIGGGGNDFIYGNSGHDLLRGGSGNDRILGLAGNDSLAGDAGNDTLLGGNGDDDLAGGAGDDYLSGGNGDDLLIGRKHDHDTLKGGAGKNTINPRRVPPAAVFDDPFYDDAGGEDFRIDDFPPLDDSPLPQDDQVQPPTTEPTTNPTANPSPDETPPASDSEPPALDPGPGDFPTDPGDGTAYA